LSIDFIYFFKIFEQILKNFDMTDHLKLVFTFFALFILTIGQLQAQDPFGGLALYTVREEMSKDPVETLEKVAGAGYAYVEAAGYNEGKYYGMQPQEFKKTLIDLGLKPMSTHQSTITLENSDQLIADAKAAGFRYFVIPVPPEGHYTRHPETNKRQMNQDLDPLVEMLNTLGKKCKDAGLQLLYHNHDFEFEKNAHGIVPIDYLIEKCNPEYVNFQMDLYWVTKAGADPVAYFKKYPGRFKAWHVKDMDQEGNFAPVGTGNINFSRILKEKDLSGMEFYLVEQDRNFKTAPLEAIKISHQGLAKLRFE
jgi:sugar phosphate isomerase/epimerase